MKEDKESRLKWDELVFSAIEKLAAAPSKLKDPKESVQQAFEWIKGLREDLQERVVNEISSKLKQLDWDSVAKKVGEHLVENFDVEVTARLSLKPKRKERKSSHASKSE